MPSKQVEIWDVFSKAGRRTDEYLLTHSVEATWSLSTFGLMLSMKFGADEISRLVTFLELSQARDADDLLRRTEIASLRGLSS